MNTRVSHPARHPCGRAYPEDFSAGERERTAANDVTHSANRIHSPLELLWIPAFAEMTFLPQTYSAPRDTRV
jgi:hypothetical protein